MDKECKDCGKVLEARNKSGFCDSHVRQHTKKTHGKTGTPAYKVWEKIRGRCNNPNNNRYYLYGGRGIEVCERWDSFENFYEDMGEPNGSSIDRIDNYKGYCKENCRWIPRADQGKNKRNVRTYKGFTCPEWDAKNGFKKGTTYARVAIYGWDWEKAIAEPRMKGGISMKQKMRFWNLEDVLEAIGTTLKGKEVNCMNFWVSEHGKLSHSKDFGIWDWEFGKPLSEQSQETIEFITGLLNVKEL